MPCSKEGVLMSFEDVLRGLQIDIPVYTQAQMEEDNRQLHVLISAAVLQREVAKNLQVHSWLVPASPECTALLLEGNALRRMGGVLTRHANARPKTSSRCASWSFRERTRKRNC